MGGLISALAGFLANSGVLRFLAIKAVGYALIVVILPIILWNLVAELAQFVLDYAMSVLPTDSFIYEMTGLAGWFAIQLSLPQAMTIIVTGLGTRFLLSAILRV
jgi:hypothetical protein